MAGRGDIEAGKAFVRIYAKTSDLVKGLKSVDALIANFGNKLMQAGKWMAGIGTAISGPLAAAVASFASTGDSIAKMSTRLGMGTNALSELGYAAGQSGSNLDELEAGVRRMHKTIAEARDGSKTARDTLTGLGVTFDMLAETPDAQLEMFADRISRITDPARRSAAAMDVFGKSGTKLLPLFEGGAEGIRALREEAVRLGQSIDPADAESAVQLGDSWDRVTKSAKGSAFAIGGALAPTITKLLDSVTRISATIGDWVRQNKDLVATVAKVGAGLVAAGGSLFALGKGATIFGGLFGLMAKVLTPVSSLAKSIAGIGGSLANTAGQGIKALGGLGQSLGQVLGAAGRVGASIGRAIGPPLALAVAAAGMAITVGMHGAMAGFVAIVRGSVSLAASAFQRLPGIASTAANGIRAALSRAGQYANAAFSGAVSQISAAIGRLPSLAVSAFPRLAGAAADAASIAGAAWTIGGRAIGSAVDSLKARAAQSWASIAGSASAQTERVKATVSAAVASMSARWQAMTAPVGVAMQQVRAKFSQITAFANPVIQRVKQAWQVASAGISAALARVSPLAREDFGRVVSFAKTAGQRAVAAWRNVGPRIAAGLRQSISAGFSGIGNVSKGVGGAMSRGIGGMGRGASGAAMASVGLIGSFGEAATQSLGAVGQILPQMLAMGSSLAALMNPATLLIGVIGAGAFAWFKFSAAGREAFGRIMEVLGPFIEVAKTTIQGISDALTAGDLALAGRIAVAGLRLAFVEGLSQLSAAVGGIFCDTLGKFGALVAGGDFAGAWSTAIQGMSAVWDAWASGVITTFTNAAKKVMDTWKRTTQAISNFLLEGAAQGGVTGKIFSTIVGVDMAELQAERDRMQQAGAPKAIANQEWSIAENKKRLDVAISTGDTGKVEELRRGIANLEKDLAKLRGLPPVNLLDLAEGDVDRQLSGTVDKVNAAMADLKATADAKAAASGATLAVDVTGGSTVAADAVDKAKADLAELSGAAKVKADAERVKAAGKDGGDVRAELPDVASIQKQATATFSAASLIAMGQGGGTTDKTVSELRAMKQMLSGVKDFIGDLKKSVDKMPGWLKPLMPKCS